MVLWRRGKQSPGTRVGKNNRGEKRGLTGITDRQEGGEEEKEVARGSVYDGGRIKNVGAASQSFRHPRLSVLGESGLSSIQRTSSRGGAEARRRPRTAARVRLGTISSRI